MLCHEYITKLYLKKARENAVLEIFSQFLYYKNTGTSFQNALHYIYQTCTNSRIRTALKQIGRRLRLGEAFEETLPRFFNELNGKLNLSYKGNFYDNLRKMIVRYSEERKSKTSSALDALQRNSTVNMFLSTLLPSFLLFLFVGTTILSQSGTNLAFISLMVLIVVPLIYTLSNVIFSRRLIEETVS
ncbi:MAG: hypothetical protein ACREBF_04395 [Candidatus Micrarchaeales archaeon]